MKAINLNLKTPDRYEIKEAFKTLKTNVLFSGSDIKAITITSSVQNEGKSFVSMELAKSLAESGKKVLLIDADLRKSVLVEKYVSESDIIGLSHYLSAQADIDDIIYETQFSGFHIIFSGPYPPNPVELLGSSRFSEMLEHYRTIFDFIIIDTPPLGLVVDAAVTAAQCDGVILNVGANHTTNRALQRMKSQLTRSGCRIIGAVLNMAETSSHSYRSYLLGYKSYYNYNKHYDYYDRDSSHVQKQYAKLNSNDKDNE